MDIIVNDTNIFIDLHSIGLLDKLCMLPCEIHTVDFVLAELINPIQSQAIKKLIGEKKIFVQSFSGREITEIVVEHSLVKGNLSLADVAVCYYARGGKFKLITGDKQLRNYAESNRVEVHGILFLFDEMVKYEVIPSSVAAIKLNDLYKINSRLPKSEIDARIRKWNS